MTRLIAGDIGGTKTILRLVETNSDREYETLSEATYVSADYPDLVPIVEEFLAQTQQPSPEIACFAIAGPVINNTSNLTNLNWIKLDTNRLAKELNLKKVSLINDFAAVSYGILALKESDIYTLQSAPVQPDTPIAILGAGTGLGEGFLVPQGSGYQVFPTEGGHTDFAPTTDLEFQLLRNLQQRFNIAHVSVERVVSGQGIVAIYQFLRDIQFAEENPKIGQKIRQWEANSFPVEQQIDPAAIIALTATTGNDPLCSKTMDMFIEAYAAEAGNLALKFLPYQGLYIAGGIAAKILPLIKESAFIKVFQRKGRMASLLEKVPVHVVLNPQVGLLGSILYALKKS